MNTGRSLFALAVARLRHDWPLVAVTVVVVYAALIQLAAAPIYTDAVATGALQWRVSERSADDMVVRVEMTVAANNVDVVDDRLEGVLRQSTALHDAVVGERLVSASFELPEQRDSTKTDLTVFASVEDLRSRAELVDGTWPGPETNDAGPILAAIQHDVAEAMDLPVGRSVELARRRDGEIVRAEIVGTYALIDRNERFWSGDPLLANGVVEGQLFRTVGPLVVDRSAMVDGRVGRLDASWVVLPSIDGLEIAQVDRLRADVERLPSAIEAELARLPEDLLETIGGLEVETEIPGVLQEATRSISVSRAGITSIALQLGALGALALAITAAILMEARRDQLVLSVTRGMSRWYLVLLAGIEAAIVVVPAAVLAPVLAVFAVDLAVRTGPIESVGLELEPSPGMSSYAVVVPAAIFMFLLLVAPMVRATRHRSSRTLARESRQATPQRIGLDLALVVLVLGAFWQLGRLGAAGESVILRNFSIDPLLIVTPPLALVSGAVVTLRIVPLLARVGDRIATRSRTVVGALVSWQLARRPADLARSIFLLALAVAILVFASTYATSWDASQGEQATQRVGADMRVHPDPRTGESLDDLNLLSAHRAMQGVDEVMPLARTLGPFPSTRRGAEFLALDARRAGVVQPAVGDPEALAGALVELAARRPELPGIDLGEDVTSLDFTIDVDEVPIFHPEAPSLELPPALQGRLDALLVDEGGLLHRVSLAQLTDTDGPVEVRADVASEDWGTDGRLRLVGLEAQLVAPSPPARAVTIEIRPPQVNVGSESRSIDLSSGEWVVEAGATGRQFEPTAGTIGAGITTGSVMLDISTGSASGPVVGLLEFRVGPTIVPAAVPVVVSESWLASTGTLIGDSFEAQVIPTASGLLEVVGSIEAFPTVAPDLDAFLIADLATVQAMAYRPDRRIDEVDEVWLALSESADIASVRTELAGSPFESAEVLERDALAAELRADPTALTAIGAFTVGAAAAVLFAVLVFVTVAATAVHQRRGEFLLLRSLGLTPRQFGRWMAVEHAVLLVLALGLGTAIGIALAFSVLPEITLDQTGAEAYPPARVVLDGLRIAAFQVVIAVAIAAIVIGLTGHVARRSMAEELRHGVST